MAPQTRDEVRGGGARGSGRARIIVALLVGLLVGPIMGVDAAAPAYTAGAPLLTNDGMSLDALNIGGVVQQAVSTAHGDVLILGDGSAFISSSYGDGSTNVTALIHAARTESDNGQVIFGPGTYRVALQLISSTTLRGQGPLTILEPSSTATHVIYGNGINNVTLRDLKIDGRSDLFDTFTTATQTVRFDDVQNVVVENTHFTRTVLRGIGFNAPTGCDCISRDILLRNNYFEQNERNAIYAHASSLTVIGNHINDAPDTGIDIGENVTSVLVKGNIIRNAQTGIILANPHGRGVIEGNILENITSNGITVTRTTNDVRGYVIADNSILGAPSSFSAMRLQGDSGVVASNYISGFGSHQIRAEGANLTFIGNTFENSTAGYSIRAEGDSPTMTANRFILGTGLGGINILGGNATIRSNTFYNADPAVRLQDSHVSIVTDNTLRLTRTGVQVVDSYNARVERNQFLGSVFNNDIVESGTSDNNRFAENVVRNAFAITKTGSSTTLYLNENYPSDATVTATTFSVSGNLVTKSGTNFLGTFDHAISADRTWTLPNSDGELLIASSTGGLTLSGTSPQLTIYNSNGAGDNRYWNVIEPSTGVLRFRALADDQSTEQAIPLELRRDGTTKIGGALLWTSVSRPTCDAGNRGLEILVAPGGATADTREVCLRSSGGTYSWIVIATG